jgi:hypothetical protein
MIDEDKLIDALVDMRTFLNKKCIHCAKLDAAYIILSEKCGINYDKLSGRIQESMAAQRAR